MSFVKQFTASIYKFREYPSLLINRGGRVAVYYIVFCFLLALFSLLPVANAYYKMNGVKGIFSKYVPQFDITDGKLNCETVDEDLYGLKIYINTKGDFNFDEMIGDSEAYIVVDNENYTLSNGIQVMSGSFSDFIDIDKDDVENYVSSKAFITIFFAMFLFMMFLNQLLIGIGALCIAALLVNIINMAAVRCNLSIGDIFKIAVYARTFPAILSLLIAMLGIPLNSIVYIGILVVYIYFALKNIQNNSGIIIAEI